MEIRGFYSHVGLDTARSREVYSRLYLVPNITYRDSQIFQLGTKTASEMQMSTMGGRHPTSTYKAKHKFWQESKDTDAVNKVNRYNGIRHKMPILDPTFPAVQASGCPWWPWAWWQQLSAFGLKPLLFKTLTLRWCRGSKRCPFLWKVKPPGSGFTTLSVVFVLGFRFVGLSRWGGIFLGNKNRKAAKIIFLPFQLSLPQLIFRRWVGEIGW